MSRSCHSAMFSNAAWQLPRMSRARPTICSQPIGLRLCGIADEPFWPFANGSSTSPISVFCRPRISSANFSSDAAVIASAPTAARRADRAESPATRRAPARGRAPADVGFDRRRQVRERADRAGNLADADTARARAAHALDVARDLGVPERQLQPERHRLGVHAVRAADHRRPAMLERAIADGGGQRRRDP